MRCLAYLKAIAQRDNGGERIDTPLKKLFAATLVKNVWMIEKADGQRYYLHAMPQADKSFLYIIDFDGKTRGGVLTPAEWQKARIDRAPQVAVAQKIEPVLQTLNDRNWERSFYEMIQAIHADGSMDPILKANLLQQVLEAGARGSRCLQQAFQAHLDWFNQAKIDAFANWVDPADAAAAQARIEAARKLDSFPDVAEPGRAAAEDLKRSAIAALPSTVGWVGCHETRDGRWECLMRQTPERSGPLLVVYRDSSGEKPRFGTVGRFQRGTAATIDTTAALAPLVAGRPVYLQLP